MARERENTAGSSLSDSDAESSSSGEPRDTHLVLLLHGLYGNPANLWCLEEELARVHDEADTGLELAVLVSKSYAGAKTWDGIDVNAHRVEEEIEAELERLKGEGKRVTLFSITGYSLGGLIARCLVGHLAARTPSFFETYHPASFCTIATPHLGVLRYGSWRSQWVHAVGQRLFSRTGRQLYALDDDRDIPLLSTMSEPDRIYMHALSLFDSVTIFANGCNDLTVPYPTAAISANDPFVDHETTGLRVELENRVVQRYYTADPEDDEVEAIIAPPSLPSAEPSAMPGLKTERPARPILPPVFYLQWRGPFRYALFPLIPFIIPVFITFAALTFALHTFQSSQRIRVHHTRAERRLLDDVESGNDSPRSGASTPGGTIVDGDTPLHSGPGTPRSYSPAPGLARGYVSSSLRFEPYTDTPDESEVEHTGETPLNSEHEMDLSPADATGQPVLTPLHRTMIRNLSSLPRLERVVAWFPTAFNAHAVIIARNARVMKWAWQAEGRAVVRVWAEKVVSAVATKGEDVD